MFNSTSKRVRKLVGAIALGACATSVLIGTALPASADTAPVTPTASATASATPAADSTFSTLALTNQRFEIYYSPNCASASRIYTGVAHQGENWINDTFNSTAHGTAGSGQKILRNAASVKVNSAVKLYVYDHIAGTGGAVLFTGKTDVCQNFPSSLRNDNVSFTLDAK